MKWYEAAGVGIVMGALSCLTFWASVQLRDAYFDIYSSTNLGIENSTLIQNAPQLYNRAPIPPPNMNMVYMPIVVTGIVTTFAFLLLFSAPIWYPYAEDLIQKMGKQIAEDLDGEDVDTE